MSSDATGINTFVITAVSLTEADNGSSLNTATRIKLLREAFGFSQRELAKRAGVTNSSISMIEQGQVSPSIHSLTRILAVFPITLTDFFGFIISNEAPAVAVDRINGHVVTHTRQQIDARVEHLLPGQFTAFDAFPVDSCGVVLGGSLQLTMLGGNTVLNQGDDFYIPARQLHRLINPCDGDASVFRCSLFVHKR